MPKKKKKKKILATNERLEWRERSIRIPSGAPKYGEPIHCNTVSWNVAVWMLGKKQHLDRLV